MEKTSFFGMPETIVRAERDKNSRTPESRRRAMQAYGTRDQERAQDTTQEKRKRTGGNTTRYLGSWR